MKVNNPILNFLEVYSKDCHNDAIDSVVVLLKPDYPEDKKVSFLSYCNEKSLKIIFNDSSILNKEKIFGIYYDLFRQRDDDLKYGILWKLKLIDYLTSGKSNYYLIQGVNAQELLNNYKKVIRLEYDKITTPKEVMSEDIFFEKVIKNLIHVTNTEEFVPTCWFLFIK
jgi:hypothetical protein